jgi:hypothetical protein
LEYNYILSNFDIFTVLFDTDLIGPLILSGFYRIFPSFVRDYRTIALFPNKSIMPLPLLGSVAAGHQTIRFLFLLLFLFFGLGTGVELGLGLMWGVGEG